VAPYQYGTHAGSKLPTPPISETGQIPWALWKTVPWEQLWYKTCDPDDDHFITSVAQAKDIQPLAQDPADWALIKQAEKLVKKEPIATFEIAIGTPLDMIDTLDNWVRNPVGIPPPICNDGPSLNIIDINMYLWVRAITPKESKDLFTKMLWGIFAAPGRWEQLLGVRWTKRSIDSLRFATPKPFVWLGKPIDTSEMYLATWLGHIGGVNPTFAQHRIKPYATCKQLGVVAATFMCDAREASVCKGGSKARRQAARVGVLNKEDTNKGEGPSSWPLQECMEAMLSYGDNDTNIVPSLSRDKDSIMTDISAGEALVSLGEHLEPSLASPMGSWPLPAPYDMQLQQSLQDGMDDAALECDIYGK
jgi:hypothetical protein